MDRSPLSGGGINWLDLGRRRLQRSEFFGLIPQSKLFKTELESEH
jgi:hypothetical protein